MIFEGRITQCRAPAEHACCTFCAMRTVAAMVVLSISFVVAGCSGSQDAESPSNSGSSPGSEPTLAGDGSGAGGGAQDYCGLVDSASAIKAGWAATGDIDVEAEHDEYQKIVAAAPSDIRADWELVAQSHDAVVAAWEAAGLSLGTVNDVLNGEIGPDAPEFEQVTTISRESASAPLAERIEAQGRIDEATQASCGVDLIDAD